MEKEIAKAFVLNKADTDNKIYITKDLQKLLDMNDDELFNIYAILDTDSGETLMHMDWAYSGEPIIMHRFLHKDYFFKHYWDAEVIDLDK